MYRIRNKAFDSVLRKYKVLNLKELTDDQLIDVCLDSKDLGVQPQYRIIKDPKTGRYSRGGFDRYKTIDIMTTANSISFYMDSNYWNPRHQEIATEMHIDEELMRHNSGRQTFELFATMGIGINKLAPGESIEVDWTSRFITEVISKHPIHKKLEIYDLEKGKKTITETEKIENKTVVLEKMNYTDLQELAKKYNKTAKEADKIKIVGLTKADLVDRLSRVTF